jgi:hypothetical protein
MSTTTLNPVTLDRLQEEAPQVKEMRRYWENSKTGPVSSKPGMSKAIVKPSTSKAIVKPSTRKAIIKPLTSKAAKAPRLEVHDENLLGDSSPPKRKRMTKDRLEREAQERAQEVARQKAELAENMRCDYWNRMS